MSYRLHLATMEKVELEKMRKLSYQEFVDIYMGGNADKYYPAYHFPTSKEVFELGSNIDSGLLKKLVKYDENGERIHFFEDQELTNEYNNENHDLYVIGKEGLVALIEDYREKIIASYQHKLEFTLFDKFEYKKDADLAFKQQCFLESRLDKPGIKKYYRKLTREGKSKKEILELMQSKYEVTKQEARSLYREFKNTKNNGQ